MLRALNALGLWRALVLILVTLFAVFWLIVAVVFGVIPVGPGLTSRLGRVAGGDFMFFYSAGVLADEGHADLVYDVAAMTAVGRARLGPKVPDLVWPYPPTISLPLALLGRLAPARAYALWVGLALASLLTTARLALGQWRAAPIALLCPASAFALFTGQVSPVITVLLTVFFLYETRAPKLAGVALGFFVWKPQFALAPAAFVLGDRRLRIAAIAATTGLLVVVASVVVFGPSAWIRFVENGLRHSQVLDVETPMSRFVTNFAAAHTWGMSLRWALLFHVITALPATAAGFQLWRHGSQPSLRSLGLAGATLQLSPYALDYDQVFLLLPWLLMIRESREAPGISRALFWPWLSLTGLVPLSYMVQLYTGHSIAGPLLFVIVGACYLSDIHARSLGTFRFLTVMRFDRRG